MNYFIHALTLLLLLTAFFLFLCLTACGREDLIPTLQPSHDVAFKDYVPEGGIDCSMEHFIAEYKDEGRIRSTDTTYSILKAVTFVDNLSYNGSGSLWGLCEVYNEPEGYRFSGIKLNSLLKNEPVDFQRVVMYHELSHCLLGIGHYTGDIYAIMYPSTGPEKVPGYLIGWVGRLDFLFRGNK